VNDGIELALIEPARERLRRDDIGKLTLGEIAPFLAAAQLVTDGIE